MAEFEAKVYRLTIEEHPNADRLELAVVGAYRSIVQKGMFKTGDLGVYIPEAAIVPDWLIQELGLENKLAGKDKNRVKAVKLRGILSQGLVYPVIEEEDAYRLDGVDDQYKEVYIGEDVTEWLGLTKYEPPIPTHMAGEVMNAFGHTIKYDIENWKKYPDVIEDGEHVVMTEKIHGTWCCLGYHYDIEHPIVTSKGLSEKGLIFKMNEQNQNNLYIRALRATEVDGDDVVTRARRKNLFGEGVPFYILCEVFGEGVQDLFYGESVAQRPPIRVFDIYIGEPGQGYYLDHHLMAARCQLLGLEFVPVLYLGPFSKEVMLEHTDGKETVSGQESNLREGTVIKPLYGREVTDLGRVILKSVSEKYIMRKDATEFN